MQAGRESGPQARPGIGGVGRAAKAAPTAARLVAAAQVAGRCADSVAAIDGACRDSIAALKALAGSCELRRAVSPKIRVLRSAQMAQE